MEQTRNVLQLLSGHAKQQFIVVASMQGQCQRIRATVSPPAWDSNCRNPRCVDMSPDSACCTQPRQIGGKPVGEIHHGRG